MQFGVNTFYVVTQNVSQSKRPVPDFQEIGLVGGVALPKLGLGHARPVHAEHPFLLTSVTAEAFNLGSVVAVLWLVALSFHSAPLGLGKQRGFILGNTIPLPGTLALDAVGS